jgi:hypothetical protein
MNEKRKPKKFPGSLRDFYDYSESSGVGGSVGNSTKHDWYCYNSASFFYTVLFPLKKNLDDAIAFCDFVIDGNGCQPMDKQRG